MHALETDDVLALAARVRRLAPGVPIVVGGHTAAAYPAAVPARPASTPSSSTMASGRCRALADAIAAGRPLATVPGLTVRERSARRP